MKFPERGAEGQEKPRGLQWHAFEACRLYPGYRYVSFGSQQQNIKTSNCQHLEHWEGSHKNKICGCSWQVGRSDHLMCTNKGQQSPFGRTGALQLVTAARCPLFFISGTCVVPEGILFCDPRFKVWEDKAEFHRKPRVSGRTCGISDPQGLGGGQWQMPWMGKSHPDEKCAVGLVV